jgi:hypothetical protein
MSQFDATAAHFTATVAGTVATGTLVTPVWTFPFNVEILGVSLYAGTAPTGADLLAQLIVNGVNAYTNAARPKVAAGTQQGSVGAPDVVASVAKGQTVQFNVAQIGSTVAGSNLTAVVAYRKA